MNNTNELDKYDLLYPVTGSKGIEGTKEIIYNFEKYEIKIDQTLDKETYKIKLKETDSDIFHKKGQLEEMQNDYNKLDEQIRFAKFVMLNMSNFWARIKNLQFRRRLQKLIFPSGIEFDGVNCRTTDIPLIFNCLSRLEHSKATTGINDNCRTAVNTNNYKGLMTLLHPEVSNGGAFDPNVEPILTIKNDLISFENLKQYEGLLVGCK